VSARLGPEDPGASPGGKSMNVRKGMNRLGIVGGFVATVTLLQTDPLPRNG